MFQVLINNVYVSARAAEVNHLRPVTAQQDAILPHQQKTFLSGRNCSVRVDPLHQSRQRHPGGRLLCARRQYYASRCIPPSDLRFFSLCRSPILNKDSVVVASCDHMSEWVDWIHACIEIAMQLVTQRISLLTFLLHYTREA